MIGAEGELSSNVLGQKDLSSVIILITLPERRVEKLLLPDTSQ